jgi:tetratricopeptide (TPR) repeat protein
MPRIPRRSLVSLLVLVGLFLRLVWLRATAPDTTPARLVPAPPPHTPTEIALRKAWGYQVRAQNAVNQERYTLEDWDPQASRGLDPEVWRLQFLAHDSNGDLRRARDWARRAAALARTPAEAYAAADLQVLLDREVGDRQAEIEEARKLLSLAPESPAARMVLRRAESNRGLARQPQRKSR